MSKIWTQEEEASRLEKRFLALKREGITQIQFARTNKIPGGASMVNQHIKNRRPISIEAAIAYAQGFKCPISEISPRVAEQVISATKLLGPTLERDTTDQVNNDLLCPFKNSWEGYSLLDMPKKNELAGRVAEFIAGALPVNKRKKAVVK